MNSPWLQDYAACRTTGIYFPAPPMECLVVTGDDRAAFLQNFCTNDIQKLTVGQSCEAFFTNVKGHVLAYAVVCREPDQIVLHLLGSDPVSLASHLDCYLIREAVTLTPEQQPSCLLVGGSRIAESIPTDFLGIPAALTAPDDALEARLTEAGYQLGSEELWNALRVEAGLPLAGIDYGEGTLPQELSRDAQAISFTKGCYLGQETVARIDALGHVNKQLAGVKFVGDAVPDIGTELFASDKQVGTITSATGSPAIDAPLGLAMVRRGSNEPGTNLASDGGDAEVVALPVTR